MGSKTYWLLFLKKSVLVLENRWNLEPNFNWKVRLSIIQVWLYLNHYGYRFYLDAEMRLIELMELGKNKPKKFSVTFVKSLEKSGSSFSLKYAKVGQMNLTYHLEGILSEELPAQVSCTRPFRNKA